MPIAPRLDDEFVNGLAAKLSELPKPGPDAERALSWMTAPQIETWWREEKRREAPPELDAALLDAWESDERFARLGIRPAKYPSFDLRRMWGQETVVGSRRREEIAQLRLRRPTRLARLQCPAEASLVFLSHSMMDLEFAVRVRKTLAERGLRPWLAAEEIAEGEPIFEAVRAALRSSRATVVAVGRHALGSAWVHTEVVGSGVLLLTCDGTDRGLMDLLSSWRPPQSYGEVNFDVARLKHLEEAYRRAWESRTCEQATLESGVGGESVRRQRPDKYAGTARELLFALGASLPSIHPARPARWDGDPALRDFRAVLAACFEPGSS